MYYDKYNLWFGGVRMDVGSAMTVLHGWPDRNVRETPERLHLLWKDLPASGCLAAVVDCICEEWPDLASAVTLAYFKRAA